MRILVAVDFSENAKKAFDFALKIARKETDTIIILTVVEIASRTLLNTVLVDFDYQILDSANRQRKEDALQLLREYEDMCKKAGVKCEVHAVAGEPKEVICEEAKNRQADLLVVGQRGLSSIQKFFLGSVSEHCSRHAPCSITIVKSH